MALDIDNGYENIGDSIQKNKTYKKLTADYKKLKKRAGNTFEKNKSKVTRTYNSYKEKGSNVNKALKSSESQLDKLLDIKFVSAEEQTESAINDLNFDKLRKFEKGGDVKKYIINKFVTSLNELKPKLIELLENEVLAAAGCSEDQNFVPNQDLYIKVPSIDFLGQLKVDPDSDVGNVTYEDSDLQFPTVPFSMNKELYNRIQNINQPFSTEYSSQYKGISSQDLFDITYVEQDGVGNPGNFYKVTLSNRITGNKIKDFLKDYYKTIDVIDFKNIFANLMNSLTGAVSISKGDGKSDLDGFQKVLLIIARVLGLCFDSTREIDVSGTAKTSELDNVDDSFFELDEVDLNFIDSQTSNILNGVAEFIDCDNVKLPINPQAIIDAINNLNFTPGTNNSDTINDATNLAEALTENPDWLPLKINIDIDFIKEFPKAVILSLLSPKSILPLAVALKSVNNNTIDDVKNYEDFYTKFRTFFINVASKIGGIFVKIIFDSVVQDIKRLVKSIIGDITTEISKKRIAIILALTQIVVSIASLVRDIRECKNVIDDLLNLLKLASKGFGNQVPLPLLLASRFLSGYSSSRAYLNIIGEFEKLGLPTGPMPDGSPNLMLASVKAMIDGMDQEESENGQVQVAVDFLSITPIGQTIPKVVYGKKL
jgi:hypothetical protein